MMSTISRNRPKTQRQKARLSAGQEGRSLNYPTPPVSPIREAAAQLAQLAAWTDRYYRHSFAHRHSIFVLTSTLATLGPAASPSPEGGSSSGSGAAGQAGILIGSSQGSSQG
eukprot:CAMPEP_0173259794 /NCGR_PEP_ID=MMETSP1142-20121109/25206_1 /TAXON_ID=483371 /ORGANISM="non described non described, Strain CCMP2298" /LENGTH=111 /DNA_ID=CAMNT_0014194439 /DNA_START=1 /DNA_END=337 /DNA_ORIENTATION=-